jgi:hypothetical protein
MGVSRTFQEFPSDAFRDEIVTLFFSLLCFDFLSSKSLLRVLGQSLLLSYRNAASSVECILMEQKWYIQGEAGRIVVSRKLTLE